MGHTPANEICFSLKESHWGRERDRKRTGWLNIEHEQWTCSKFKCVTKSFSKTIPPYQCERFARGFSYEERTTITMVEDFYMYFRKMKFLNLKQRTKVDEMLDFLLSAKHNDTVKKKLGFWAGLHLCERGKKIFGKKEKISDLDYYIFSSEHRTQMTRPPSGERNKTLPLDEKPVILFVADI